MVIVLVVVEVVVVLDDRLVTCAGSGVGLNLWVFVMP